MLENLLDPDPELEDVEDVMVLEDDDVGLISKYPTCRSLVSVYPMTPAVYLTVIRAPVGSTYE